MFRVPYDIVSVEANRIIIRMAVASSWEESYYYWDLYYSYINNCGWSNKDFDKETLLKIDATWEKYLNQTWN